MRNRVEVADVLEERRVLIPSSGSKSKLSRQAVTFHKGQGISSILNTIFSGKVLLFHTVFIMNDELGRM
jgi:hypothetical protein